MQAAGKARSQNTYDDLMFSFSVVHPGHDGYDRPRLFLPFLSYKSTHIIPEPLISLSALSLTAADYTQYLITPFALTDHSVTQSDLV